MSKKVFELARELDMESKELLERIKGMGIEAKGHNSVLSDIDAKAVANIIIRSRKKTAETKIVTAAPVKKTKSASKEKEVKISVKPAAAAVMSMKKKAERKDRHEPRQSAQKVESPSKGAPVARTAAVSPPPGIPLPRAAVTPPMGVPLPKSESKQPVREELIEKDAHKEIQETVDMPKEDITIKSEQARQVGEKEPVKPEKVIMEAVKQDPPKKKTEPRTEKQKSRAEAKEPARHKGSKQTESKAKPTVRKKDDRPKRDEFKKEAKKEPAPLRTKPDAPKPQDVGKKKPESKGRPDKVAPRHEAKKSRPGLPFMEKPPVRKPHKQRSQKPKEQDKEINLEELEPGTKIVNVPITVKGLSEQIDKSSSDVIMALMKLGIMANINQNLDEDMVILLGDELSIPIVVDKIEEEIVEKGLELFEDSEEDLTPRSPVITVMGHVDHGKTSLLDAIRKTSVTTTESGGITQHIGASEAVSKGKKIVFLDTPGHEAFTTMRARGAHVTDIAVLVVAADDSVKPQTVESISHAKAAGIPVIVAINKMDKPDADPQRVMQDLTEHDILVEEWGGETICVPVSAKTGEGIPNLLEMILLQAEVLELKANPDRLAAGTVIEARLDKAKGPVATLLVLNGTLQSGDPVVAGTCHGRVRAMTNYKGDSIKKAGPATAVEITGLTEVPEAGDEFHAVKEDRTAREIAEQRKLKLREEIMARNASVTLEQLFSQIKEGEVKELNLIIKADVQGSVGALTQSLEKLQTENVKVRIIHTGVGTVTESDIMLAGTSNAIIIGFNVRPSTNISALAEREKVEIRSYRIIYEIIDDIEAALKGLLDPVYKEIILGKAEIRNIFKVPGAGMVGGAYVQEGKVLRNSDARLLRDGIVVFEGKVSSLKRYKDDVREVAQGYECGIGIENFNDIKEGDIVEAYKMEEIVRK